MARVLATAKEAIARFWDEKIHFIELHYLYIMLAAFVASGFYYFEPGTHWEYIDALFMATTAATNTGLNTIAMSDMSTYKMLVVFFTMFLTSHVTISYIVLVVRKHYFSKRFEDVLLFNKARRARELQRRERKRDPLGGLELGLKRRRTATSTSVDSSRTASPKLKRRMSMQSSASTPVNGAPSKHRRRSSVSNWMSDTHEIHTLIRQFRERQRSMMDRRQEQLQKELEGSPTHPYDTHAMDSLSPATDDNDDGQSSTTRLPNELRRVASSGESSTTGQGRTDFTDANTVSGTQGIAFAGNIEQQREMARQRLEKDRRFDELMQKIAREDKGGGSLPDVFLDSDDDSDDDDIESIMRQPIDKSQLTRQQRYRIGGAEYRAIDMLTRIVPIYYLGFVCVSSFLFRIYIATSTYAQEVLLTSNPTPVNPWFFSFFMGLSSFNNLGLNHLDASVVPFQNAPFPLLVSAIMILIGNTMYAVCLRFVIWVLWRLTPESHSMQRETFRYLLDHPRRCYTSLFPSTQTWWLFFIGIALTVTELVCFIAFNYWLPVLSGLSWGSRVLDGFFQSVATRNGTLTNFTGSFFFI